MGGVVEFIGYFSNNWYSVAMTTKPGLFSNLAVVCDTFRSFCVLFLLYSKGGLSSNVFKGDFVGNKAGTRPIGRPSHGPSQCLATEMQAVP